MRKRGQIYLLLTPVKNKSVPFSRPLFFSERSERLEPIVMRFVQAFSWLHFARTHNLDTQVAFWIHAAIA